jgi:hypothetical protein
MVGSDDDDGVRTQSALLVCFMSFFLFFFFFFFLRCPLHPYTYTHTPSHHQLRTLIRIFFSIRIGARASCRARRKSALVFFFPFSRLFLLFRSLSFSLSLPLLCYATLWSNTTSSKSTTTVFQSKAKENGRQRWHVCIIIFRSLNTMTTTMTMMERKKEEKNTTQKNTSLR